MLSHTTRQNVTQTRSSSHYIRSVLVLPYSIISYITAHLSRHITSNMSNTNMWKTKVGSLISNVRTTVDQRLDDARRIQEAKAAGKIHHRETNEWCYYYLDEDLRRVEEELASKKKKEETTEEHATADADGSSPAPEKKVADRTYYDLLQVPTNVDAGTLKKAYYKLARTCHPDKHPDDPDAQQRFQTLGHAYQVLSSPQTRAYYDQHGVPSTDNNQAGLEHEIDPMIFFNVMFGSAALEPYIGELWIAQASDSLLNDKTTQRMMQKMQEEEEQEQQEHQGDEAHNPRDDVQQLQQLEQAAQRRKKLQERLAVVQEINALTQQRRQIQCAINFRERIQPYLDAQQKLTWIQDHVHKWERTVVEEANQIAAGAYGSLYCQTIGYTLMICAEQYLAFHNGGGGDLGQTLSGYVSKAKQTGSTITTNFRLIGATLKAASAGAKAMQQTERVQQRVADQQAFGMPVDEMEAASAIAETMDQTLPAILEFTWAINRRDIQNTLKEVFRKLLDDNTLEKSQRHWRAEALLIFGRQFYEAGKRADAGGKTLQFDANDIKARMAAATMTTMAKAQGQEVSAADAEDMIQQAKQQMQMQSDDWKQSAAAAAATDGDDKDDA
jgi:curved DNA-binding protein CbpA